MRLFTGVDLPAQVTANLEQLLAELRPCAHVKWSPVYNLHITLKFIGEWPAPDLDKLQAALSTVGKRPNIALDVRGLGWFPNPNHPRVFWAGAQAGPELAQLAADIATALVPIG